MRALQSVLLGFGALVTLVLFLPAWRGSRSKPKHERNGRVYRGGLHALAALAVACGCCGCSRIPIPGIDQHEYDHSAALTRQEETNDLERVRKYDPTAAQYSSKWFEGPSGPVREPAPPEPEPEVPAPGTEQ